MPSSSVSPSHACTLCERHARVDENGRCEACVFAIYSRACILSNLEGDIESLLNGGMTGEELHEALDLMLSDREGTVAMVRRESDGGAIWIEPNSAFLDHEDPARQTNLGWMRRAQGWTLERLAEAMDASEEAVALWERGAPIPHGPLERLARLLRVQPHFLAGES
jgi:DNA-binding transcriptional regulator YiaG